MEEEGSIQPELTSECAPSNVIKPDPHETLSLFDVCHTGEPLAAQLLVMDFTATEADTNYLKKKCSAFWNYIYSRKDLHSLMVKPETNNVVEEFSVHPDADSRIEVATDFEPEQLRDGKQSTAVSMLEFVEKKGLINRIFEVKLQRSDCSLGAREYIEEDPDNKTFFKPPAGGICSTIHASCPHVRRRSIKEMKPYPRRESTRTQYLCRSMQEWDEGHPKSMKPPDHPPSLSYHPVVQRNIKM